MKFPTLSPIEYQSTVYRNIFTCSPSQDLMSDICPEDDYEFINKLVESTSGIDHSKPQFHRPFQYSQIYDEVVLAIFKKEHWKPGRFSDGMTYGVWYAAEDELASTFETCWVSYRIAKDNVLPCGETYSNDRRFYSANVKCQHACDLSDQRDQYPNLTHPYNYDYCQELGLKLKTNGIELLKTRSARKIDGICTPIFMPDCISNLQQGYYLKIHVNPDETINVSCQSRNYMNFTLSLTDIEDPYMML